MSLGDSHKRSKEIMIEKWITKCVLIFALCTVSCVKSTRNEGSKENIVVQRSDADTIIGVERLDSAFIEMFYNRFIEFNSLRERVVQFYTTRDNRLAWTSEGLPTPHAKLLVNVISNINEHGLPELETHFYNIRDTLSLILDTKVKSDPANTASRKSFDLALTSLFFQLAPRIWQGSIDPQNNDRIDWFIQPNQFSYQQMLDSILNDSETNNPFIDYRQFNPQYLKLKKHLRLLSMTEKKQASTTLQFTKPLSRGDSADAVRNLAARLSYFGDMPPDYESYVFDSELEEAVRRFQARHGLAVDGVVGEVTAEVLNVSIKDRIQQIIVNMERWRWVPPGMNGDYIYVNIPQFELSIYRNNKEVDRMKVIVGKEGAETIVFNDEIKYVVINPYWNIPNSIAIEEVLPKIKKDKNYLIDANIDVGVKWNFEILNQDTINWNNVSASNFPYTLRKKPGPDNPLGQIKFIFPNSFAIYLHDTPVRELFDKRERGFSHGCIRIEKPFLLADLLLVKSDRADIQRLLEEEQNNWITLPQRMPIYILYFTTWVDAQNQLHFTDDIYGHDADLAAVLFRESRNIPDSTQY
jgi:L,D-transpeptidase YcbB